MQIIFFAARRIQRNYFQQLSEHLACSTRVVYYKSLWLPGIAGLWRLPLAELREIVGAKLREKMNTSHRQRPALYWQAYRLTRLLGAGWLFLVYYRWFHRHPCAIIGLWNGNKFRQRVIVTVAHVLQRELLFFENGLLPNTTTVDRRGVNALNSLPRDPEFYRRHPAAADSTLPRQLVPRPAAAPKQASAVRALPEHFVFVPFQVNSDSQITLHSPWIPNMWQLFSAIATARRSLGTAAPHFVFKEHPSCPQDYRELHRQSQADDQLLFANDHPTQELIEKAEAVITINSTVGLEALLLDKKVIVLGDAFYNMPGLTQQASSLTELEQRLRALDQWQIDQPLRHAFLHHLHRDYAIPDNWSAPTPAHWQAMNTRLGCAAHLQPAALFLVSTPLNLFIASGIATRQTGADSAHLVFIDQTSITDNPYITAVHDWPESPFASVTVLPAKARRLRDKPGTRRNTFHQLETLIHKLEPARIYTGSDRRLEFQFAMHTATRLQPHVTGVYMDDGTFTYVGRNARGAQDIVIDNLLKKLVYGHWWRQPPTVGASDWISEAFLAFPALAHPLIRAKRLHELDGAALRAPAVQALSDRLLAQFGLTARDLEQLDILVTLPHDSLISSQRDYRRMMTGTIETLSAHNLRIGVKYHPRHAAMNDLDLRHVDNTRILPQQLGFESMLPLLGHTTIVGDVSTTLLSAKWLRPDLTTVSLLPADAQQNPEFLDLFARLGIPVVDSAEALLPLLTANNPPSHA